MDSRMSAIGSAVYVAASIFDHSCVPNAYASFKGKKVVIRSLVDWPELDLTKVFISYVDVLNGTSQRRSELWQNWYFWCQCQLCNDQERIKYENAYKCDNPDCQLPVPVPEKPTSLFSDEPEPEPECGFCGTIVDEDALEEYHSAVAYTRQRLRTLKETDPSLEVCLSVIEKQKDLFSSMNLWRVKALDNIFNATYYNGMFSPALQWGYANLEGMKIYYGVNNPTLGMFLMKLGKAMLYLKDYKGGLSIVEEAERILSVALGPEHRLVAEDIRRLKVMALQDPSIYLEMRVLEKEKKEHEMVCKHCGKKKNQPQKAENDKEDLDKPKKVVEKSKKAVEIPVQKEQKVQNKPVNGILRRTILDISLILKTVDTIEPPKSDDTSSSDSSDDSDSETEVSYDHYALINGEIKKVPREMTATIYRSKFNTGNKKIYMANAAVNKPNGKMNGVKDDNKKVKEINGVINGINDKMTSDHDEMKKRIEDLKKLNNQLKELNSKIEIFDGEIGVDKSKTKQVNGETKNYKVEMKENGGETKEINKELKKDGGETKEISKGMKTDIEDIKEINKEMNEAKHEVNGAKPKRRFAFDYPPENRVIVRY